LAVTYSLEIIFHSPIDSVGKRCKACRLRQCNLAGMEYRPRKKWVAAESSQEEEEEEIIEIVEKLPLNSLKKFVAGYNLFLKGQKNHFQRAYGKVEEIGVFFYGTTFKQKSQYK
jgi:hypothetical protein